MAHRHKPRDQNFGKLATLRQFYNTYINYKYLSSLLVNPSRLLPVAYFLFFAEVVINVIVINCVKYTEIDWKAYMQEVEGVLNGTFDYSLLKGDTGPLVYPAGFVWIYSCLYVLTSRGENILLAQYIFASFYLINLVLVLRIYLKCNKLPPYVLILTCLTSYRIHSIFALRLFNDPIAIILLYASINAILSHKWNLGSFLYSLAVSVKMNILLFAPALLLAYCMCLGIKGAIKQLAICGGLQIFLALPFLLTHPINYLLGAFNLGRVFMYEWTVNWRFLPEDVFVDKRFHAALLLTHILLLVAFYKIAYLSMKAYAGLKAVEEVVKPMLTKSTSVNMNKSSLLFLLPMFLSNFIGVACSRTLHYQFYVWYFHSLPYLLWTTHYSIPMRLAILGILELCWNTFPSTALSSLSLHFCHLAILYGIFKTQSKIVKEIQMVQYENEKKQR